MSLTGRLPAPSGLVGHAAPWDGWAALFEDAVWARADLWWTAVAVFVAIGAALYGWRARLATSRKLGAAGLLGPNLRGLHPGRRALSNAASVAAIALIVLALWRPQYGGETERLAAPGIDIVLVVDYSKSMLARDVAPNRSQRVAAELGRFLDDAERRGDRVGLVIFAGAARGFPLTRDMRVLRLLLDRADPRTENPGGTAIGRGLALALQFLQEGRGAAPSPASGGPGAAASELGAPLEQADQVIILLTDGEDTETRPLELADRAAREGVRIYTVAIGSALGEPIPKFDQDGNPDGIQLDERGEPVMARVDVELLQEIARRTDGAFVHVDSKRFGLDQIRREMEALRTAQREHVLKLHRVEGFGWLVGPAILLLSLGLGLGDRRRIR